jgi:hypothetical protein
MKNSLIKSITSELNITSDIKHISIVDALHFKFNSKKIDTIMLSYSQSNSSISPVEKYIINLNLSEYRKTMTLLDQNYHGNLLLMIYFVIGNPYSIDSNDFIKLAEDKTNVIQKSAAYIILILEKMIQTNDLYKFYNHCIIEKWTKSIINKPVTKEEYFKVSKLDKKLMESRWKDYERIFNVYNDSCLKVKEFLVKLEKFYLKMDINNPGCYTLSCNITRDLYMHCVESHTGLKIDIDKLESWALLELEKLSNQMKNILKQIDPTIDTSKSHVELLKLFHESQKYNSKEEFIEHHKKVVDKYHNIFINIYKFKEYAPLNLIIFDNKFLAGGYYYDNNFYLNTAFWKNMAKYNTESLILHEAYPGHHLQINLYKYANQKDNLLYAYYHDITNGFSEGWGLFSETLGSNQTNWDKIGHTEFDIFRTLRIIVDIRIHTKDFNPKKTHEFIKQYLNFADEEINSEVYRYTVNPGQAVSYKLGSMIFKKIMQKLSILNPPSNLSDNALKLYKEIIDVGPMPLEFLLKKYKIDINEIFL